MLLALCFDVFDGRLAFFARFELRHAPRYLNSRCVARRATRASVREFLSQFKHMTMLFKVFSLGITRRNRVGAILSPNAEQVPRRTPFSRFLKVAQILIGASTVEVTHMQR